MGHIVLILFSPTPSAIKTKLPLDIYAKTVFNNFTKNKIVAMIYHLKTGQETPVNPPVPPIANSSALPLKSLITFPVLTSNIFSTTL